MKIGIIKGSSIGNGITALPMAESIKARDQRDEVVVIKVGNGPGSQILENYPKIDKVITIDQERGFFNILFQLFRIRKEKFDVLIDGFPNTVRTAVVCFRKSLLQFLHKTKPKKRHWVEMEALGIKYKTKTDFSMFEKNSSTKKTVHCRIC